MYGSWYSNKQCLLRSHGQILLHPLEKAEALNNFCLNIFCINEDKTLAEHGSAPFKYYGEYIYYRTDQLTNLNVYKKPGPDSITYILIHMHTTCKTLK